jgi:predicted Rossmann fold nucleotide-binding protein DprA/Smf involved in DNA uptake
MITAHEALEQGRDVYVYLADCCYDDVRFAGSLQLIEDGAQGFSCAEELLEAIIGDYDEMLGMPDNKRTYPCQLHHSIGTLETELTKLQ